MKKLILLMGVAAITVVILVWLGRKPGSAPEQNVEVAAPARAESNRVERIETRAPAVRPRVAERTLELPKEEVEQLSPQAQRLMGEALRTFRRVELEKRNFAKHSPGEVLLSGAQRKLFLDDYTYAMILSGADCSRAEQVYTNLVAQIADFETAKIQGELSGL